MIAGISGDSGKTILTCGLVAALVEKNIKVSIFKKGPDYIDTSWISLAANSNAYNLDTYLFGNDNTYDIFVSNSLDSDISVIEANRGLFDGFDIDGSHSSAELAKLLSTPIIIILNTIKFTRTAAAIIYGLNNFDKNIKISGVVLNQIATKRHENIALQSIEKYTNIPVIGVLPKIKSDVLFPSRHLGLVTTIESVNSRKAISYACNLINNNVDIHKIINIASNTTNLIINNNNQKTDIIPIKERTCIGILKDKAFSFYYQENIQALKNQGANIIEINSLEEQHLPNIHALYIGGGFPEVYIEQLSKNIKFINDIKEKSEKGLPIFAECGGMIFLGKSFIINNIEYPLCNIFPFRMEMTNKPQAHGYSEIIVDKDNPYFKIDFKIRGHEFHYSKIIDIIDKYETCFRINRGAGAINNRDGFIINNCFATFLHIHSNACKEWAESIYKLSVKYKYLI